MRGRRRGGGGRIGRREMRRGYWGELRLACWRAFGELRELEGEDTPAPLISLLPLLKRKLQKRLPRKPARDVIHARGHLDLAALAQLLDLLEGRVDAVGGGDIRANPHGFPTFLFDLLNKGLVAGGVAGEEDDWIAA